MADNNTYKVAGNIIGENKLYIKWASMSLHWGNPSGEDFQPWLENVKSIGYDGVTCFSDMGLESFFNKPSALSRALSNAGLALAAVDMQLHAADRELGPVMDLMNETGCRLLACIVHTPKERTPDLYKHYAETMNKIGERACARGICAHLHNNTDSILRNFTDWELLAPLIDWSKVSFMADTGHVTKDFAEKPHVERAVTYLDENWDKLHYLELKDYNAVTGLDTPLGEGLCDFAAIFAFMKARGYSGWITVEQNRDNGLSLGRSPDECARVSLNYARAGLGI